MTGQEMLKKQEQLSKQYKYKNLPPLISSLQRKEYEDELPLEWRNYHGQPIYSKDGVLICNGLTDRVYVCGDYGIFLEADTNQMNMDNIVVKPGQEYRIYDEKYSNNVKYHWYIPKTGYPTKIYFQQKGVTYADYLPNKWYFSPYEVMMK